MRLGITLMGRKVNRGDLDRIEAGLEAPQP